MVILDYFIALHFLDIAWAVNAEIRARKSYILWKQTWKDLQVLGLFKIYFVVVQYEMEFEQLE